MREPISVSRTLSNISTRLLVRAFQCKQPLIVRVKCLVELLTHTAKSPYCATNGMQFIRELLTQNADGSAVALQEIADAKGADMVINLYEFLHCAHAQVSCIQKYCSDAKANEDTLRRVERRILQPNRRDRLID